MRRLEPSAWQAETGNKHKRSLRDISAELMTAGHVTDVPYTAAAVAKMIA
jgi:hypothetical protein